MAFDQDDQPVVPLGSVGFRWGQQGKWNLEAKESSGRDVALKLTLAARPPDRRASTSPISAACATNGFKATDHADVLTRNVPVRTLTLKDGDTLVTTVFDLLCANYGLDRGLGGDNVARDYDRGHAVYPGLGRGRHRRAARAHHPCRPRVRHQRRENQWPLHGHPRCRAEPLVPHGHDLPRHHQHAGVLRLHRPIRRRLVALRRPGEAAAANRLGADRLRRRLGETAAPHERHVVLLCAHRPVAIRDA